MDKFSERNLYFQLHTIGVKLCNHPVVLSIGVRVRITLPAKSATSSVFCRCDQTFISSSSKSGASTLSRRDNEPSFGSTQCSASCIQGYQPFNKNVQLLRDNQQTYALDMLHFVCFKDMFPSLAASNFYAFAHFAFRQTLITAITVWRTFANSSPPSFDELVHT